MVGFFGHHLVQFDQKERELKCSNLSLPGHYIVGF